MTVAIHRHADAAALRAALAHPSARVQAAAMLLLDQPPRPAGALPADAAFERLSATDDVLRQTALQRVEKHPEWAARAVELIRDSIAKTLPPDQGQRVDRLVLAFESDPAVQQLVADALAGPNCQRLLETLGHSRLRQPPGSWVNALVKLIDAPEPAVRDQSVRTAAALQSPALDDRLASVAADASRPAAVRAEALRAVVGRRPKLEAAAFDLVLSQLGPKAAPSERLAAAALLGRAALDEAQARAVLAAVRGDALVSPAAVLPPLAKAARSSEAVARELVSYLTDSAGRGWEPSPAELDELVAGVPEAVRGEAAKLRDSFRDAGERRVARLAEYAPLLAGGDAARGRAVFFGNKVACATCHRVGAEGGQVGPDLTKVGAVRAGRDILESIVLPSSTFAQGFDPYVVQTKDGEVYAGIIPQPDADVIEIRDSAGKTTRLHKDQVKRVKRQAVSIMPEGLPAALTKEEFRDLLAFVQSLK
jgi:putative heme-binding domain-containing protein